MKITTDFPGGNIVVEEIDGDVVRLHQDLRDTDGDWFYWHFEVAEAKGRTLRFEFTKSPAISGRGPAVSLDQGASWQWLNGGETNGFLYTFPEAGGPVLFCVTIPYTEENWRRFLADFPSNLHLRTGTLCESRKGRPVEKLICGCLEGKAKHRILVVTRHHCCETMTSLALEGLIAWVLGDEPASNWFCANVELVVIPFMDKDGVQDGDQGKNRLPRDHNRDYEGESIYPETRALRALVESWSDQRLRIGLDLHCPWLFGGRNERIYFVGQRSLEIWREQQVFSDLLEKVQKGPLPFYATDDLPYGEDWNVERNFSAGKSCAQWLCDVPGLRLVSTVELPYANARGVEVNAVSARAFGADLGRATCEFLK